MLGARSKCWNKWWVCPSAAIHTEVYTEVCVLSTNSPEGVHNTAPFRRRSRRGCAYVPCGREGTRNFKERNGTEREQARLLPLALVLLL